MFWLTVKRRKYSWRVDNLAMQAFLQAPLPSVRNHFSEVDFLVADLEMTSLNAAEGEIASIGWVTIKKGVIQLSEAEHYFAKIHSGVGQSAVIHHIRDSELDNALPIAAIMDRFLAVAAGKVLVFHNAQLDMAFLNRVSRKLSGVRVLAPVSDTFLLEKRRVLRSKSVILPGELRLHSCRQHYGLPDYPAHDALTDALATAELFLAWAAHSGGKRGVNLGECFS